MRLLAAVYCGKGFTHCQLHFFFSSFLNAYVAVCGVFSLLRLDEANSNVQNKLFFFSSAAY